MDGALVTMVGNAASNVTYRETTGGVAVASFRLAATERRYDRERGDWADGETTWVTVVAWRRLAVNLVGSVNKGDPVVVSGRLRVREWGEEASRRTEVEIDARAVGHDLTRGTSTFRRAVEARPADAKAAAAQGSSPGEWPVAAAGGAGRGGSRAVCLVEEAVPEWIVRAVAARREAEATAGATAPAAGAAAARRVARAVGRPGLRGREARM
ncbi:single-stranded DNA-binding protein [Kitasatospora cheerisanensis]|uniref:Single-stranded DNA-binding protein n=1 Tax=Kitasatospora cheerisanensis KCTC 2395 TaxID=1348663 RepID=A0A066YRZ6_9ACTN|nr:single-stranded DNA-binding protein [Kitasatospora cheerisanensis]KDN82744.1 putative single-stranded DNA-binding protein [Kitasatospora cheerisanensis KCTC 2395]